MTPAVSCILCELEADARVSAKGAALVIGKEDVDTPFATLDGTSVSLDIVPYTETASKTCRNVCQDDVILVICHRVYRNQVWFIVLNA